MIMISHLLINRKEEQRDRERANALFHDFDMKMRRKIGLTKEVNMSHSITGNRAQTKHLEKLEKEKRKTFENSLVLKYVGGENPPTVFCEITLILNNKHSIQQHSKSFFLFIIFHKC